MTGKEKQIPVSESRPAVIGHGLPALITKDLSSDDPHGPTGVLPPNDFSGVTNHEPCTCQ